MRGHSACPNECSNCLLADAEAAEDVSQRLAMYFEASYLGLTNCKEWSGSTSSETSDQVASAYLPVQKAGYMSS
jgi:hypothetical protein